MTPKAQDRLVVVLGIGVVVFGIVSAIYALRDNDGTPDPMFAEIGLALAGGIIAALGVRSHNSEGHQNAPGPDHGDAPDSGPEPVDDLPEDE